MTSNQPRPPSNLPPRSKAATASSAPSLATPAPPSAHRPLPSLEPSSRSAPTWSRSEQATVLLVRRTLCAHGPQTRPSDERGSGTPAPLEELLPSLTSSNEVDLQLYALIAVIIQQYISPWYGRITPDHEFVEEITQIIAHCTRALEQRLREVDLETLLLDEIPALFNAHIIAHRTSHHLLHPPPLISPPRQTYHALHPHPALSPVPDPTSTHTIVQQQQNETVYRRLLAQRTLAVLLPAEDLKNDCLRTLVEEILAETILGNVVAGKASQGWLWWQGISQLVRSWQVKRSRVETPYDVNLGYVAGGLDISASKAQASTSSHYDHFRSSLFGFWWSCVQVLYLIIVGLRFFVFEIGRSYTLPARSPTRTSAPPSPIATGPPQIGASMRADRHIAKRPIVTTEIWTTVSLLLNLGMRLPLLRDTLQLFQWGLVAGPGQVGATDGAVDRLLASYLDGYLFSTANLPRLISALRTTLSPPPPPPPPTPEQIPVIKAQCAQAILAALPGPVRAIYFPAAEQQQRVVEDALDVFGDDYCMKHFLYATVEAVLVRLFPELGAQHGQDM